MANFIDARSKSYSSRGRKQVTFPVGSSADDISAETDGGRVRLMIDSPTGGSVHVWLDARLLKSVCEKAIAAYDRDAKLYVEQCTDARAKLLMREPSPSEKWARNFMSGAIFIENVDASYTCSPASETYWSS